MSNKLNFEYKVKRFDGQWLVIAGNTTYRIKRGEQSGSWMVTQGCNIVVNCGTLRDGIISVLVREGLV